MFSRNSRPILRAMNESKRTYVAVINFDRLIELENGFVRIKFRIIDVIVLAFFKHYF